MKLRTLCLVVGLWVATANIAHADQPWAQGVSEAQKAEAQKKLEEGNALFLKQNYPEALKAYQAAVAQWDHPAIRFNIVRCLIQLDQPVPASDNLQLALKYGAAPLEEAVYTEALAYQKLLANQIAEVEISCKQDGAKVTLDGETLIAKCPGSEKRRVKPGQHGVVTTKEGFLPQNIEVVVVGGNTETVETNLVPLAKAAKIVHRWPTWIPWVVFGGGLVVAGFGGVIEATAFSNMSTFDKQVSSNCQTTGCDLNTNQSLRDQRDDAKTLGNIGIAIISVGAAGAVAGGVLLVMNRGQTVYEQPEKQQGPLGTARLDYVPHDGGGVLTLSGRF
ncbi:MAG TPA: tetratricopeptide repeat protein [Kofleriaceae bacterium]|nr:tetratricopeptide repeat protein [Kofleriaceae bacterium]